MMKSILILPIKMIYAKSESYYQQYHLLCNLQPKMKLN